MNSLLALSSVPSFAATYSFPLDTESLARLPGSKDKKCAGLWYLGKPYISITWDWSLIRSKFRQHSALTSRVLGLEVTSIFHNP